jgi:hypothetical protein
MSAPFEANITVASAWTAFELTVTLEGRATRIGVGCARGWWGGGVAFAMHGARFRWTSPVATQLTHDDQRVVAPGL